MRIYALLLTGMFAFVTTEAISAQSVDSPLQTGCKENPKIEFEKPKIRAGHILDDFYNQPEIVLVTAHRAAHKKYPENSLAAVNEAIELGADIVEIDLRQTRDGEIVLMHDRTIDRTTTGEGEVGSITLEELQTYSLFFEGEATQEKVPTFEELLQLTKGRILVDVDFKLFDHEKGKQALSKTYELIEKYHMEHEILMFLSDYTWATELYSLNKEVKILPVAYNKEDVQAIGELGCFEVIYFNNSYSGDPLPLMKQLRQAGKRIWYTSGRYDGMELEKKDSGFEKILEKKYVNMIMTDLPDELLRFLRKKGLRR